MARIWCTINTMKNRYGTTPWGKWFVEAIENYKMADRLDRGKSYANTGKVLSLEIREGAAKAKVKGKEKPFYKVQIVFPPMPDKKEIYKMIEEDPLLLARISGGELPENFLEKLKSKNISIIPKRWSDMERRCTCSDWGDPCKHMAALYYIIAREIDTDPGTLFRLRGMDLAKRFGKKIVRQITPPFTVNFADKTETPAAEAVVGGQTAVKLGQIPHCGKLIAALLPPQPSFYENNFTEVMADFYRRVCDNEAGGKGWGGGVIEDEQVPQIEHEFSRSHWTVNCPEPKPGAAITLVAQDINGGEKEYELGETFDRFVQFANDDGTASYRFLFYLFKFLNLVCDAGAFIPYALVQDKKLAVLWRPFETLPEIRSIMEEIAAIEPGMFFARKTGFGIFQKTRIVQQKEGRGKRVSAQSVVDLIACAFLTDQIARAFAVMRKSFNKYGRGAGFGELLEMFFQGRAVDVSSPAHRSLPLAVDQWLAALHIDFSAYNYSITVNEPPAKNQRAEPAPRNFALSMEMIVTRKGAVEEIPLSRISDLDALRVPVALSNYLPEIQELSKVNLTEFEAAVPVSEIRLIEFLDSAAALLQRLGIKVNLPKSLQQMLAPKLLITAGGKTIAKFLNAKALTDFDWRIAVGRQIFSASEFEELVKQKSALLQFKDGFVKMDADKFAGLLKRAKASPPGMIDFIQAHFSDAASVASTVSEIAGDFITDMTMDSKLRKVAANLFKPLAFPTPGGLAAKLRPYQKRGYSWACSLLTSGFGCIFADDMGLGKTVQSIAVILRLKEEGRLEKGGLIVAPAALLDNWEKELERFAPSLSVARYHGSRRRLDRGRDLLLTTYQTAVRDDAKLAKEDFSLLLLDEAHLVKNAKSQLSRTVKRIPCEYRIALSGTPVENRLEDLRSLFDFIFPGYLGSAQEFKENFRVPIEVKRNQQRADALWRVTSPFLLRRLKTDKNIIKDLPDKIVKNEYAHLEKDQAALYESVVAGSLEKSKNLDAYQRHIFVLSMLTHLKQICDHPRVFDKVSPAVSELSGKAQLLLALLEKILANREKTLVFSQYVETIDCLKEIIQKELGEAALVYHGGLGQKERAGVIECFQNDPSARILLVSLKAGGLGLNLTAASRVIHYDLWYNPAVENQATDRAFRIGQTRNVFVHRFIVKNTFEEKIDAMLASKQELADLTVASGETWIARMSYEELRFLFTRPRD